VQTLRAAREGSGGELAPSPAVSLLERASTIRALPVAGTQAGTAAGGGGGGGLAGKKQSSLPQLEDAIKVEDAIQVGPSAPAAVARCAAQEHTVHLAPEGAAAPWPCAVRLCADRAGT